MLYEFGDSFSALAQGGRYSGHFRTVFISPRPSQARLLKLWFLNACGLKVVVFLRTARAGQPNHAARSFEGTQKWACQLYGGSWAMGLKLMVLPGVSFFIQKFLVVLERAPHVEVMMAYRIVRYMTTWEILSLLCCHCWSQAQGRRGRAVRRRGLRSLGGITRFAMGCWVTSYCKKENL